jgi:pimeloyl-ACP methyl ester carboxylesterase
MGLYAPSRTDFVDDHHGWDLEVRRYDPSPVVPRRPPLVMVPGYAMNTHVLAFHPRGASLVEHLVSAGFEVWTANLRTQGGSRPTGRIRRFGLAELALQDVPAVFDHVLANTATGADRLDAVGCSLGGSLLYAWLAHHPKQSQVRRLVTIGGPLNLEAVHPLFRLAFRSSRLAGAVPIHGTRAMARVALPWLEYAPWLLSIYMNTSGIDLSAVGELVSTVDDPVPYVNRQLARWIRSGRLKVRGLDVAEGLRAVRDVPMLAIFANRDGIVTPASVRSIVDAMGDRVTVREVGTDDRWYAHADMFIGHDAAQQVFVPLEKWLLDPIR